MSRTMVIGLDGASLELIEPWARAGYLPNLMRLMTYGSYGHLRSVMPVLSSAAWVSFATGVNPGRHGIYDFVQRDLTTYKRKLVYGGATISQPSLWKQLSDLGKRVIVCNVPMTYPVEPVNGILIAGLGTPDHRPFAYPQLLNDALAQKGYRVNKRFHFVPGREHEYLDEIYAITDLQAQNALELARREPWDFFMHVVREPDEIAHFYWRFMDQTHPQHDTGASQRFKNAIFDYYCHVDQWVGRFVEVAGDDTDIIIISDHGSGPLYKDVMLNRWLEEKGYLKLKNNTSRSSSIKSLLARLGLHRQRISDTLRSVGLGKLESLIKEILGDRIQILAANERQEMSELVDWSQTRAYSFGYHGQIYLNLSGREHDGIVEASDYDNLCRQIASQLTELIDPIDAQKVVTQIFLREELFRGEKLDWSPDLTVVMRDLAYITRQGYEFSDADDNLFAIPHTGESGSHREMGVLIACGPSLVNAGYLADPPSIIDIAPTVLALLTQTDSLDRMDGKILLRLFKNQKEELLMPQNDKMTVNSYATPPEENRLEESDEAVLWQQLRSLGYVE
ncbi:MAG: alkaline phosphatase family protein [Caldilineaceae bacterium]